MSFRRPRCVGEQLGEIHRQQRSGHQSFAFSPVQQGQNFALRRLAVSSLILAPGSETLPLATDTSQAHRALRAAQTSFPRSQKGAATRSSFHRKGPSAHHRTVPLPGDSDASTYFDDNIQSASLLVDDRKPNASPHSKPRVPNAPPPRITGSARPSGEHSRGAAFEARSRSQLGNVSSASASSSSSSSSSSNNSNRQQATDQNLLGRYLSKDLQGQARRGRCRSKQAHALASRVVRSLSPPQEENDDKGGDAAKTSIASALGVDDDSGDSVVLALCSLQYNWS